MFNLRLHKLLFNVTLQPIDASNDSLKETFLLTADIKRRRRRRHRVQRSKNLQLRQL